MKRMLLWAVACCCIAAMALGCDSGVSGGGEPQCGLLKIAEGCKAQCSRLNTVAGKPTQVCIKQLIARESSKNNILHNKIKKVQTVQLPSEVCFQVDGNKPSDPAVIQALTKTCKGE